VAKVIFFAGEKGGSGKSSLAHLAAHGFGSLPRQVDAVVVVTDPSDEIHEVSRRYFVADGRDHGKLAALLARLDADDKLMVIVDGAAAATRVDEAVSRVADLICVPCTPAHHDVVRAARSLARLSGSVAVPNRWPTHPGTRKHANDLLTLLPKDRTLGSIAMIPKVADLLHPEQYGRAATTLSRPGQSFAIELLHRMKIHPFDMHKR
jgi:chromosome partitioning protein